MLSNKAVPRYYGEFREKVIRGEIPVCNEISMEMNRIDDLIRDPRYFYDDKAIEGFIEYCENELTLSDGSDVFLLDTFKLWAESLLSWFYFETRSVFQPDDSPQGGKFVKKRVKKRLVNKQFLIIPRRAAKSMYLSFLQSWFVVMDTSTTDQVATAPTMRQADETLAPIRTAITRSRGPLFQFLTAGSIQNTTGNKVNRPKLYSSKLGIVNSLTDSIIEVRPMSIDKLQGLRCKVATLDEWLSGDIRENPITALEQSASKIKDYVIVCASSEGTVRNGSGDTIKMELQSILRGEYYNPHVSIWYYKLDNIEEVSCPELWLKANPNLGFTVDYETYQLDVERAEKSPSTRNEIFAKIFDLPLEGYTYYFTYEETQPHHTRNFWRRPCSLGIDLSRGDDFCAFTFLFPLPDGCFGVKTRSYISSLTYSKLPLALHEKYQEFLNEGTLMVLDGAVLNLMEVYDDIDQFIRETGYSVYCVGYDPYNADKFIERWMTENSPFGVEKVLQGSRTESVPLGELKSLAESRMLLFDESLMCFTMGNAITVEDSNGNRKLLKRHREEKIDNVSALLDAFVAYKNNIDMFTN